MKNTSNLEYVQMYADKLKNNPGLFCQQKMLIDSQITASRSLFGHMLEKSDFKAEARTYLKKIGLL